MAHFIDKDALVEKIERRTKYNHERAYLDRSPSMAGRESEDKDILSLIDTLEVTEVDLEKYINKYFKRWYVDLTDQGNILHSPDGQAGLMSVKEVAKHFFELGLSVSNKAQKGK